STSAIAPHAPQGADARQQVSLTRQDVDGQAVIRVEWRQRIPGDTNLDGQVNAADLVPLAQHLNQPVGTYDDHLSFLDPNSDGYITVNDVTIIARHWGEQYDGFRVYRRLEIGRASCR